MKKIVFYVSLLLSVFFFIKIMKILIYDYTNLTNYGMGFLTGQILLLVLFLFTSFKLRKARK
ncbi:hypothetical protein [Flavobacterium cerinum]|uniref:C4-dicarboxylate ABC transporter n=1 Tax=Flavobacterium cerinum TaxID=2502784 RepID=A0ABY5IST4_9FLAO|nr:hypothetical protein [Flavobacterium cerinum]UUC44823.1 hypothetical protein NOX80_14450 [Flavobacterium cerinum]